MTQGRTATFAKAGAVTVTFDRGESFGWARSRSKRQVKGMASGGSVKVNTLSTNLDDLISIQWDLLEKDTIDNVITFFEDSNVNWAANTFTYTDYAGNAFTVRLWSEVITRQILNVAGQTPLQLVLRVET